MTGMLTGTVKSFNPEKGWGHIDCAETFQMYGKDIFLLRSQLAGAHEVAKGAPVSFQVVDNGRGPEAVGVQVLTGATGGQEGGAGAFVGTIKSFNPNSGWGHITCAQTEQIYGKDIFFMRSQLPNGFIERDTPVHFSVKQGLKGPEAVSIQPLGQGHGAAVAAAPALARAQHWGPPQQHFAAPALPAPRSQPGPQAAQRGGAPARTGTYYGTVKSYNEEKGWGHISCNQTREMYGKDMFVMRSALNGATISTGDWVQFGVIMGMKGPEAVNVLTIGQGTSEEDSFSGTVKQFDAEKGYGFIFCDETRQIYGRDIFIHRNILGGHVPAEGEAVQFSVQMSESGRPEATNINFGATQEFVENNKKIQEYLDSVQKGHFGAGPRKGGPMSRLGAAARASPY